MNDDKLISAGFSFNTYVEGCYWELIFKKGNEADRIAEICKMSSAFDFDEVVEDMIILQCDENFNNRNIYCNGDDWDLTNEEFLEIVEKIIEINK